jgi:hypothetical protein
VGFRAVSHRARDQKLGVSARQLAGGRSPVDGNFNHGQARLSGSDAQEFVTALKATLFIYF